MNISYGTTTSGTDYYNTVTIPCPSTTSSWSKSAVFIDEDSLVIQTKEGTKNLEEYIKEFIKEQLIEYEKLKEYINYITITDINVYGSPEPKVVEVTFKYDESIQKIKAICDKDDVFNLEYGIYVAIAKYIWGKHLTPAGIEMKAKELSMYRAWDKTVNKAIKCYFKKLKDTEDAERKETDAKEAKLRRRNKNQIKKRKKKDKAMSELKKLMKEAMAD